MIRATKCAAVLLAAQCLAPAAFAQTATNDAWTWRATMYGWFPSIHSSTQAFDVAAGTSISSEVDPGSYLSNLKFGFMGALEARKGPWSFAGDALYLAMGNLRTRAKTISGPGGRIEIPAHTNLNTDMKGFIGTIVAGYAISTSQENTADAFLGVRHAHIKTSLDWEFGTPVADIAQRGGVDASKSFTDGLVGLRGRAALGDDWFVPYHVDLGAGSSRFTWQALAGIGRRYAWGDVTFVYRHLEYDFESDRPISDLRFSGPQLGIGLRF